MKLSIRDVIRLHIAMMLHEVMAEFSGQEVTTLVAYDIMQKGFDFTTELKQIADNLGRDESTHPMSRAEEAEAHALIARSRHFAAEEYPTTAALMRTRLRDDDVTDDPDAN